MSAERPKRSIRRRVILATAIVVLGAVGWYYHDYIWAVIFPPADLPPATAEEKAKWAKPMDASPVDNFYKIDENLYRGAQPDAAGMRKLKELGIRTVVNLRLLHDDTDEIGDLDLKGVHIPIDAFKPKMESLVEFLRVATDPNCQPVYVHCQRGIDRTGAAVAAYRVVVCGWTKMQALKEMFQGPYGYDHIFPNVPVFLEGLDFDEVRRQLKEPPATDSKQ